MSAVQAATREQTDVCSPAVSVAAMDIGATKANSVPRPTPAQILMVT